MFSRRCGVSVHDHGTHRPPAFSGGAFWEVASPSRPDRRPPIWGQPFVSADDDFGVNRLPSGKGCSHRR